MISDDIDIKSVLLFSSKWGMEFFLTSVLCEKQVMSKATIYNQFCLTMLYSFIMIDAQPVLSKRLIVHDNIWLDIIVKLEYFKMEYFKINWLTSEKKKKFVAASQIC